MATATIKRQTSKRVDPAALAAKFRAMADGLQSTIEDKRRPMTQNATRKRLREYERRKLDGDNLERGQRALRALADAWERGDVPACIRGLRSKTEIMYMMRHAYDDSGDYLRLTGKYADTSPDAKALQQFVDDSQTDAGREANAERQRLARIERMEHELHGLDMPGFFPTPRPLIERMLEIADIQPGNAVLEPSAGKGDIADLIAARRVDGRYGANTMLDCVEINPRLQTILGAKGHCVVGEDFMRFAGVLYDRIIMNPPFERGQDAEHVRHAFDLLAPAGRLVALMSVGPFQRQDKKCADFREWLRWTPTYSVEDVPPGAFQGVQAFRQTDVSVKLVVIQKPK